MNTLIQLDDLPLACVITSSDGHWISANRHFKQLFASALQDGSPQRLEDLLAPASRIFFHTHVYPLLLKQGHVDSIACHMRVGAKGRLPVYLNGRLESQERCIWLIFGSPERQHFETALIEARRQAEQQSARLHEANQKLEQLQSQLVAEMEKTAAANKALADLAMQDSLTQLGNRRALDEGHASLRRRKDDQNFGILLIDIDHFKLVNDRYGHARGDIVLREVAACLQAVARRQDQAIRYGGEEFILLLENIDLAAARNVAARLHEQISEARPGGVAITVSIGIAIAKTPDDDLASVIKRADEALYEAKRGGRNQTVVA